MHEIICAIGKSADMANLTTQYTRLNSVEDLEEDLPPQVCHVGVKGQDQEHEKGIDFCTCTIVMCCVMLKFG